MSSRTCCLTSLLYVVLTLLPGAPVFAQTDPPQAQSPAQQSPPPIRPARQEMLRLKTEGEQAANRGDYAAAVRAFESGLAEAKAQNDTSFIVGFLSRLSILYYTQGQFDKALDYGTQTYDLVVKTGNPSDIAAALNLLGGIAFDSGRFDQALDYHSRALTIQQQLGDKSDIAAGLNNVGMVYASLGQFDAALDDLNRALALKEFVRDPQFVANFYNNLGLVYEKLGQYAKAQDCQQQALRIRLQSQNPLLIATSYGNLGDVYWRLGEYDKAIDFQTRALTLREKSGIKQAIAGSLNDLGLVYATLGQYDTALDYFRRALKYDTELKNPKLIADTLNNIGSTYQEKKQFRQALDSLGQALKLREQIGDPQALGETLANLGLVYLDQELRAPNPKQRTKTLTEAAAYFTRALRLFEKIGNSQDIARCLSSLGTVNMQNRDPAGMIEHYSRALALFAKSGTPLEIARAESNLGLAYLTADQFEKAETCYVRAVRDLEIVGEQVEESSRIGALQELLPNFYSHYALLLFKRHRIAAALQMAERGRAQGLARQAAQSHADLSRLFSAADAAELQQRTEAVLKAIGQLRALQNRPIASDLAAQQRLAARIEAARSQCAASEAQLAGVRARLLERYPTYRHLQGQSLTTTALHALAQARPDTLFLEFAVVDAQTTLLFALSRQDGLRAFALPLGESALAQQVAAWRKTFLLPEGSDLRPALRNAAAAERRQAHALYAALFDSPAERGRRNGGKNGILAGYAHLVLIADGPLLDLPFAALRDSQGKRLVERCAVSSAVSLAALTWHPAQNPPTASLLCVTDPAGPGGERPRGGWRGGFAPLPQARREGFEIARLFPDPLLLQGAAAQKTRVTREMAHYAVLHFATHGLLVPNQGLLSALALAPGPPDSEEDGFLEAREVAEMRLSAKMAVLSACGTGQGQKSGGDGLLGLAWAFQAAGCPSVVASQWSVNDETTSHLMVAFYRALKHGLRKDEALRAAMRRVQQEPDHASPYYWAAFQLMGDADTLGR